MTLAVQILQFFIIFFPWSLYVWIKVSKFGSQPECNHLVKYVFFFVTVRATANWLRIVLIILLFVSMCNVIYITKSCIEIISLKLSKQASAAVLDKLASSPFTMICQFFNVVYVSSALSFLE